MPMNRLGYLVKFQLKVQVCLRLKYKISYNGLNGLRFIHFITTHVSSEWKNIVSSFHRVHCVDDLVSMRSMLLFYLWYFYLSQPLFLQNEDDQSLLREIFVFFCFFFLNLLLFTTTFSMINLCDVVKKKISKYQMDFVLNFLI